MPKQPKIQRRPRLVFDVDDTLRSVQTGEYNDSALEAARKLGYKEVDFCTASVFGTTQPDNSKAEIVFPNDKQINGYATGNATRLKVKKHVAKKGLTVAAVVTTASHLVESELGAYYKGQVESVEQIAVDYHKSEKARKKKNPEAAKEELHFNTDPRVMAESDLLARDTIAHEAYRLDPEWMKNKIQYEYQVQYLLKLKSLPHKFAQKETLLAEIKKQLDEKKAELALKSQEQKNASESSILGQEKKTLASKLLQEVNILQWQIEVLEKHISGLAGVADVTALSGLIDKASRDLGMIKRELKEKLENSANQKRNRNKLAHEKTDKPGNFYEGLLYLDDRTTYSDDAKEFMLRGIMSLLESHENMIMVDDRGAVVQRVVDMNAGKGLYAQPCKLLAFSGSAPPRIDSHIQIILSLQDKNCTIRFPLPFALEGESKRSFFEGIEEQNKSILPYTYQFTDEEWKALKINDTKPETLARVEPLIIQILSRKAQIPPKCDGRMHGVLACMSKSDEEAIQDTQYYLRQFIQGYSLAQLGYLLDDLRQLTIPASLLNDSDSSFDDLSSMYNATKNQLKEWIGAQPQPLPKDLLARLVLAVAVQPADGQNLYEIAQQISELLSQTELAERDQALANALLEMFKNILVFLNTQEKAHFAWACYSGDIKRFHPDIIGRVKSVCQDLVMEFEPETHDPREVELEDSKGKEKGKEKEEGEEEVVVSLAGLFDSDQAISNTHYSVQPQILMNLLIASMCSSQEKSIQIREMRRLVRLLATMNPGQDLNQLHNLAPNILFAGLVYCIAEKEKQEKAYKDRKQKAEKAGGLFEEEAPSLQSLTHLQALCATSYLQGSHQWDDLKENLEAMKKLDKPADMPPLTSFYGQAKQLAQSQRSVPSIFWLSESEPVLNGEQQTHLLKFMAWKLRVTLEPEYLEAYVSEATRIIETLQEIDEAKPFIRRLSQDIANSIWKEKDPATRTRLFEAYLPEEKDLDFRWLYLIQSFSKLNSEGKVLPKELLPTIERLISSLSNHEIVTEDNLHLIQNEIRANLWSLVGASQPIYDPFANWFIFNQPSTSDSAALRRFVQITSYCLGLVNTSEDDGLHLFWRKLQELPAPFSEEEQKLIRFAAAQALGNNKALVPTQNRQACTGLKLLDSHAEWGFPSRSEFRLKEDGQYCVFDKDEVQQRGSLELDVEFMGQLKAFQKLEQLDAEALHQKFIALGDQPSKEEAESEGNQESTELQDLLRAFSEYQKIQPNPHLTEEALKKAIGILDQKEPNKAEKEEEPSERAVLQWMVENHGELVDGLKNLEKRRDCRDKLLELTRAFFLEHLFDKVESGKEPVQVRKERESNNELQARQAESTAAGTQILNIMMAPLDRQEVEKREEEGQDGKAEMMPLLQAGQPQENASGLVSFKNLADVLNFIKMLPSGSERQARNTVALKEEVLSCILQQEISAGMRALVSGILNHQGTLIAMKQEDLHDLVLAALLQTTPLSATPSDEEISTRLSRIMGLGKSLMGKSMRPCSSAPFEVCQEIPEALIEKTIYLKKDESGYILSATVLIPHQPGQPIRYSIDLPDWEANENTVEQYRPMIIQKITDKLLEQDKRLKEEGLIVSKDTLLSMEYSDEDVHSKRYFQPMIEIYQQAFNGIVPHVKLSHQSLILNLADEARNLNVMGQNKVQIKKKQDGLEKVKKAGVVILEDVGRNETTKCTVLQSILRMASVVYDSKNPEETENGENIDALTTQAKHQDWQKDNGLKRIALAIAGVLTLFIGTAVTLFFKHKQETRHAFSTAIEEVGLNVAAGG